MDYLFPFFCLVFTSYFNYPINCYPNLNSIIVEEYRPLDTKMEELNQFLETLHQDPHFKVALTEKWNALFRSIPAPSYSLEGIMEIIFQSAKNESHWADSLKPRMGDEKSLSQGNNAVKTLALGRIKDLIMIPRPTRESLLQFIHFMVNELQESF